MDLSNVQKEIEEDEISQDEKSDSDECDRQDEEAFNSVGPIADIPVMRLSAS